MFSARRNDHYRTAGMMIAWSIARGGPAGNFFCPSLYNTIAYGYSMSMEPQIADIPDPDLKHTVEKVSYYAKHFVAITG